MSLQSISRFSNNNLGGILELRVASASDFESIPDPVNGIVFGDVVFKAGKSWSIWEYTHETSNANSRSRQTREGSSKQNRLPFFIAKDRAEVREILLRAETDEMIVLFKDANGVQKIFGLLDAPVRFKFDHDSGAQHADRNNYDCEFYFSGGPDNMYEYNGAISSAPAGTAPAIVRFNGVAIASLQPGETLNLVSDFGFTEFYITA